MFNKEYQLVKKMLREEFLFTESLVGNIMGKLEDLGFFNKEPILFLFEENLLRGVIERYFETQ